MSREEFLFKYLNSVLLGVSQLADTVPLGGKNYLEITCDNSFERMFDQYRSSFNPASNEAIDLCRAWIATMENERFCDKNDYEFNNEGDFIKISVNKENCFYHEYCIEAREKNLPVVCPRMLSCRWIATKFSGRQYQLKTEEFSNTNRCMGAIYPEETISEILSVEGDNITFAGERAIVLSTHAYGILIKTIYNYAPHLLERVLFESTYYSSLSQYEKVKNNFKNNHDTLEHLLRTIERLGNIRYEIMEYDELNKRAVIRGHNSYMAAIFKKNNLLNTPKTSCASGRGRLAAYFSGAWGEEIVCEEVKCEAFGDDYCEFILLPKRL